MDQVKTREEKLAYGKKWRSDNPNYSKEYNKKYYAANRGQLLEDSKVYRENNKDKRRDYVSKNRARISEVARNWARRNPRKVLNMNLKRAFGISLTQFEEMNATQEGRCSICQNAPQSGRLVVDHNHETGKVRSLLCHGCNKGLGFFKENPSLMAEAAKYIQHHNG